MPEDFVADYDFLAALASAHGWRVGLSRIENGDRFFLRLWAGERYLGGVRFARSASRDKAAAVLFDSLHGQGVV